MIFTAQHAQRVVRASGPLGASTRWVDGRFNRRSRPRLDRRVPNAQEHKPFNQVWRIFTGLIERARAVLGFNPLLSKRSFSLLEPLVAVRDAATPPSALGLYAPNRAVSRALLVNCSATARSRRTSYHGSSLAEESRKV